MRIGALIFFTVAGAITGLAHVYLYRRLLGATVRDERYRRWGRWLIAGLWLLLFSAGPLAVIFGRSSLVNVVSVGAWMWMGLASFLVTLFAAADLLLGGARVLAWARPRVLSRRRVSAGAGREQGVGGSADAPPSPERRLFLSRAIAGGAVLTSGGLTAFGTWRAYTPPDVTDVALKLPRLPRTLDGLSIVHLSDIHVGPLIQRRFLEEVVRQCNALKPDLVAITGDLVDGDVPTLGPAVAALSELKTRFGTYFVTGNHEYYSGDEEWCVALEQMGLTVLRNRWVSVGDAGGALDLVGVDDWRGGPGGQRAYDLARATSGRAPARPAVLLAHQPQNFEGAVDRGIGLQLSGHTHGGQMFPMTLAIPLLWKRSAGHYTHRDGHLYVSRGTGFWGPPVRVGSPPEIVKVTLLAG